MAAETKNIHTENRETAVKTISKHIEDAIELQRDFGGNKRGIMTYLAACGKTRGAYVSMLYVLVKLVYIGNVVGQFFLLNAFLGPKYKFWGAEILSDLVNGREWVESGHFPRVTMCDFEVRVMANLHHYTIQCVLMINMFNEKIFLFLWWWFVVVSAVTIISFFHWVFLTLSNSRRLAFVTRYLRVAESPGQADRKAVRKFVTYALRPDGVFILRMISNHAGDLTATEIILQLWRNFRDKMYTPPTLLIADFKGPTIEETENIFRAETDQKQGQRTRYPSNNETLIDSTKENNHRSGTRTLSYEKATAPDQIPLYQSSV